MAVFGEFFLFFSRLIMPLKHSSRLCNPSARAVTIAAVQPTPDSSGPSSVIRTLPILNAALCVSQPFSIPPEVLDQLVARMADKVTWCLSHPEDTSSTSIPSALSEVLLVSTSPAPAGTVSVPGTSAATPGLAGDLVQGSLSTTQRALSSEVEAPSELFPSPSLLIDARVSENFRAKIWNNECVDFYVLLYSPVFEDRYQVTISNSILILRTSCKG